MKKSDWTYSNPISAMKFATFTFIFFALLSISLSLNQKRISKVICSLSRSKNADLLRHGSVNSIKLSKSLFQECNINFRVISNVKDVKNDFISFTNPQKSHKETFWPLRILIYPMNILLNCVHFHLLHLNQIMKYPIIGKLFFVLNMKLISRSTY